MSGSIANEQFRLISMILTVLYFALGASGMYIRERSFEKAHIAAETEESI